MASKPNFFVSTQSVHGNFMKSDMDTYLSTIRRMIQQKCKDTQELIQSIRRNRIGDGGHVTPNEFRFTLIKFGVILPQALVDKIFAVFDGDRSGTMDFDEFAMWIMNSEFMHRDTSGDNQAKLVLDSEERERLRQKLIVCIQENQQSFAHMKRSVSFLEFVSEVNRKQMPITEKEARSIFVIFDPKDTGFMDTKRLRHWAQSGALDTPPPSAQPPSQLLKQRPLPTLAQSIAKVCGTNTLLLLQSIQHLPRGAGIRVPLEEFRRCLLSNGLGQNVMDTKELYSILCGGADALGRGASIDALYDALVVPAPRPEQIVSMKPEKPQFARTSHAHRRLREALRKTHKLIKAELEAADKGESGWVECTVLHSLLIKHAMPLSYQDFRYITMQFKTEENATKVNWQQFLAAYQPTKAPHILDSVSASIPEIGRAHV
jgi:Ca2+-binding EF-hand superfamily protein